LHEFLAGRFLEAVTSDKPHRTAIAAPRGNAKTTWVSVIGPLWCLCHPDLAHKRFIVLLSDTISQAEANLEAIREELEGNAALRADYGDLVGDPLKDGRAWTRQRIVTANGIQVAAYGAGKSMRGIKHGSARPDLLVADDLENDENVLTPGQRRKLLDWWTKTATKLGGPGGMDIFAVGTILHYDSLLSGLLANPGYQAEKFKALAAWPIHRDLWDEWERIYLDLSRPEPVRKTDASRYYLQHQAAMDEGALVLWPQGDPLYGLMEMLATDGPAAFDSEKQNEPINPEDCLFEEAWFHWYARAGEVGEPTDIRLPAMQYCIGAVDPSLGKHATRGDYSAIVILGRGVDGRDYVLDADIARRSPDRIISDTIAMHQQYNCREWAVEAVAFQEFFAEEMASRGRDSGVHLPIVAVHPHTDKALRIQTLQPAVRNGHLVFHRSHRLLYDQMRMFPLADHDDGPDALHMAYERGQGQTAMAYAPTDVPYRPKEANIFRTIGAGATMPRRGGIFDARSARR
jgi:predicted phage terminase large subunit-like protein